MAPLTFTKSILYKTDLSNIWRRKKDAKERRKKITEFFHFLIFSCYNNFTNNSYTKKGQKNA